MAEIGSDGSMHGPDEVQVQAPARPPRRLPGPVVGDLHVAHAPLLLVRHGLGGQVQGELGLLLASLSATPLRRLTGIAHLTRLRKPLGLWAFAYAFLHMLCYLVFDQSLLWGEILNDIVKRPYITVGFAAFLILETSM